MKHVRFPNPFGIAKATKSVVARAQRELGFSDACARFFIEQGGLSVVKLATAKGHAAVLEDVSAKSGPDLGELFDLDRAIHAVQRLGSLSEYFFPIGKSYGGDPYVEILRGVYAGFIASIAHGARPGDDIPDFANASADERADLLAAPELDFLALHAPSVARFLEHCILIDEKGLGRVRDTPRLPKPRSLPKRNVSGPNPLKPSALPKRSTAVPKPVAAAPPKAKPVKLAAADRKYLEERHLAPDVVAFYASRPVADVTVGEVTLHSLSGLRAAAKTKHGATLDIHRWPVIATVGAKYVYLILRDLGAYYVTRAPIAKISMNKTKGQMRASFTKEPRFESIAAFAAAFEAGKLADQTSRSD